LTGAALTLAACGSSGNPNRKLGGNDATFKVAESPHAANFPAAGGRTLQAIASQSVPDKTNVAVATTTFVPGTNRFSFGLLDASGAKFVYGETAVYIADRLTGKAQGPFVAPAESLVPAPQFISQITAADAAAPKAVYAAQVPFRKPGSYAVLAITRRRGELLGALAGVKVAKSTPIPGPGQRPPAVDTPTAASVGGDIKKIDTRVPVSDMHKVSFKDVLGHKPVVLVISTPQLCQSRVCGPVTDLTLEVESRYVGKVDFIHQEVYNDNQVNKGIRPQVVAFHVRTEPWLFAVNKRGIIVARLEGAFGLPAINRAAKLALGS
jgi:hypothetical protein